MICPDSTPLCLRTIPGIQPRCIPARLHRLTPKFRVTIRAGARASSAARPSPGGLLRAAGSAASRWPETRAQRSIRMRAPVTDLAGTPNAHRLNGYNLLKKRRIAPARRCGGCRRRTDGRVATFHTGFRRPTLPRESRASEFMPLKATKPLAKVAEASGTNIPEDKSDQKACRRLRGGNLTSATSANVPGAVLRTTEP